MNFYRAAALRSVPPPSVKLPVRPNLVITLGAIAALCVGTLLAVAPALGVGALGIAIFLPTVLIDLPLGVVLWTPLAYLGAVPLVGLASNGALAIIVVTWLSVVPNRRSALAQTVREHAGVFWALGLLTAWATLSIAWSTDPAAAADYVSAWYLVVTAFAVVATTITKPDQLVNILLAFIAGAVLATTIGLSPVDLGTASHEEGRIGGGLGDPNYLAAGLVIALAMAVGFAATTRNKGMRICTVGLIAYMAVGLAQTGSRGGLLAAVIAIAAAAVLARSGKLRAGVIIVTVLAAATLWVASSTSSTLDRYREFDTGGTGRVDLWNIAWRISEDHPVTGVGVNNFRAVSYEYVREPGSPSDIELIAERPHVVHSIYLQQLAETGVVGLALLLTVLGICLRTTWRAIRRLEATEALRLAALGRAILVAQIGALSASLLLSNAYSPLLWILLALSVALTNIARWAEHQRTVAA